MLLLLIGLFGLCLQRRRITAGLSQMAEKFTTTSSEVCTSTSRSNEPDLTDGLSIQATCNAYEMADAADLNYGFGGAVVHQTFTAKGPVSMNASPALFSTSSRKKLNDAVIMSLMFCYNIS